MTEALLTVLTLTGYVVAFLVGMAVIGVVGFCGLMGLAHGVMELERRVERMVRRVVEKRQLKRGGV